jgi:hypothetical protein
MRLSSGKAGSKETTAEPQGVSGDSLQEWKDLQAVRIWTRTAQSAVNAQLITEAEIVGDTYVQDKRGMGLIRLRRHFCERKHASG